MEPSLGTRLAIDSDNIRASLKVARTLADSSDFPETVSSLRLQEADLRGRIAFAHAQVRYQLDHRDYLVRDLERVCELIHNRSDSVEAGLVSPLSRNSRCPRSCCQQGQRLKRAIRVVGAPRTKRGLAPPPVVKFHPWLLIFHRMLSVSFFSSWPCFGRPVVTGIRFLEPTLVSFVNHRRYRFGVASELDRNPPVLFTVFIAKPMARQIV